MATINDTALAEAVSIPASSVSRLSSVSLANVVDQSVDCVKLVDLDGTIQYMNGNGLCAMEVDDFCAINGTAWAGLWPEAARLDILASYHKAAGGAPPGSALIVRPPKARRDGGMCLCLASTIAKTSSLASWPCRAM